MKCATKAKNRQKIKSKQKRKQHNEEDRSKNQKRKMEENVGLLFHLAHDKFTKWRLNVDSMSWKQRHLSQGLIFAKTFFRKLPSE